MTIEPQPGILDIELYVAGKPAPQSTRAPDGGRAPEPVKLSANENPFGPSPAAVEAYRRAALSLHRYPGTDHAALRNAIAEHHGLDPERVICGVGSDEVLNLLAQAYLGAGDEAVMTEYGFLVYPIITRAAGATPVVAKDRERVVDVDAILGVVNENTRLVFLANPNNPTGTMIGGNELRRLADGLPDHVLLVLDGAYAEFAEGYDGGLAMVEEMPNVFMTRTFSKLYGLGGLRVGWGYGAREIIDVLNRIRQPFNLGEGQIQAAIAALGDEEHREKSLRENARLRVWLRERLIGSGIAVDPSHANFLLARFRDAEEAAAADAHLQSEGIVVRAVTNYGLPQALRITVGDEASCRRVAHAMAQFMEGRR